MRRDVLQGRLTCRLGVGRGCLGRRKALRREYPLRSLRAGSSRRRSARRTRRVPCSRGCAAGRGRRTRRQPLRRKLTQSSESVPRASARKSSSGSSLITAFTRRSHRRAEGEERALEIAARRLVALAGAEVPAERRLRADLEVGDVRRARSDGRRQSRRGRRPVSSRRSSRVIRPSRSPRGRRPSIRACRRSQAAIRQFRDDDRPSADHDDVRAVAESLDRLVLGAGSKDLRRLGQGHTCCSHSAPSSLGVQQRAESNPVGRRPAKRSILD